MDRISEEVTTMRAQANSLTLYEQFQKAKEDTQVFLDDADNFSRQAAKILGFEYTKPPNHTVVKLPDMTLIEALMGNEEMADTPDPTDLAQSKYDPHAPMTIDLSRALASIHNKEIKMVSADLSISEDEVFNKTYEKKKKWTV